MPLEPDERPLKASDAPDDSLREPDQRLDATGLDCPLPLLKAKQALAGLQDGDVLEVIATDAGSWRDFESFVAHSQHRLLERVVDNGIYRYRLQKAGGDAAR